MTPSTTEFASVGRLFLTVASSGLALFYSEGAEAGPRKGELMATLLILADLRSSDAKPSSG